MKILGSEPEFAELRALHGISTARAIYTGRVLRRKIKEMVANQSWALAAEILLELINRAFPDER